MPFLRISALKYANSLQSKLLPAALCVSVCKWNVFRGKQLDGGCTCGLVRLLLDHGIVQGVVLSQSASVGLLVPGFMSSVHSFLT